MEGLLPNLCKTVVPMQKLTCSDQSQAVGLGFLTSQAAPWKPPWARASLHKRQVIRAAWDRAGRRR